MEGHASAGLSGIFSNLPLQPLATISTPPSARMFEDWFQDGFGRCFFQLTTLQEPTIVASVFATTAMAEVILVLNPSYSQHQYICLAPQVKHMTCDLINER